MESISALLAFCAGKSPATCKFPAQRPATQSFDVFLDLRLNKRLSTQSWGWWFETPRRPLWRHCNVFNVDALDNSVTRRTAAMSTVNSINSLWPGQNGRNFADDTFKRFSQNENVWISITISLKFVLKAPINNIPSLVLIMAWRRPGDKPLCEPMVVSLLTHICVTRPQ